MLPPAAQTVGGLFRTRPRTRGIKLKANRGIRVSFATGCPDLADSAHPVFDLLKPEQVGLGLTKASMMARRRRSFRAGLPHPEAKYFKAE